MAKLCLLVCMASENAIRFIGHDAAAFVASSEGTGVDAERLQQLALAEAKMQPADRETRRLFAEGVHSHWELQRGFRGLQWARFLTFHKLASAYRLAQRKPRSIFTCERSAFLSFACAIGQRRI